MANKAPDKVDAWMEDFDRFKTKIQKIFGNKSKVNVATRNIQILRQTRSVANYTATFQQYALLTE
jgi:hypothetical protein